MMKRTGEDPNKAKPKPKIKQYKTSVRASSFHLNRPTAGWTVLSTSHDELVKILNSSFLFLE